MAPSGRRRVRTQACEAQYCLSEEQDDSQEDRTGRRRAGRAAGLGERGVGTPTAPAESGAAAPVQCSTKLLTLRPHYPDPVKPFSGAAGR